MHLNMRDRSPKIAMIFLGTDSPLALGIPNSQSLARRLPIDGGHPQPAQSPTSKACVEPDP